VGPILSKPSYISSHPRVYRIGSAARAVVNGSSGTRCPFVAQRQRSAGVEVGEVRGAWRSVSAAEKAEVGASVPRVCVCKT